MNQRYGISFALSEWADMSNGLVFFDYLPIWQNNSHPIHLQLDANKLGFYFVDSESAAFAVLLELDYFQAEDKRGPASLSVERLWDDTYQLSSADLSLSTFVPSRVYADSGVWKGTILNHHKSAHTPLTLSLSRLLLDLLFEFEHSSLLQVSPHYDEMREAMLRNPMLRGILSKAEAHYQFGQWKQYQEQPIAPLSFSLTRPREQAGVSQVPYERQLLEEAIAGWKKYLLAEDVPSTHWFQGVEQELQALIEIEKGTLKRYNLPPEKLVEITHRFWGRYDIRSVFRNSFDPFSWFVTFWVLIFLLGAIQFPEEKSLFLILGLLATLGGGIKAWVDKRLPSIIFALAPKLFFTLFGAWLGYSIFEKSIDVQIKFSSYGPWLGLGLGCLIVFLFWIIKQAAPDLRPSHAVGRTSLNLLFIFMYTLGIGLVVMETQLDEKMPREALQQFIEETEHSKSGFTIEGNPENKMYHNEKGSYKPEVLTLVRYQDRSWLPPLMWHWGSLRVLPYHLVYYSLLVAFFGLFLQFLLPGKRFTDW